MNKSFSVVVALICGTMATVLASRWLNAKDEGSGIVMADIFVATTTIDVGDEITPDKIKLEKWPADRIPPGSTGDLPQLRGKFAKQRFYEGEAIMPVKLMDDDWTEVPRGYRVVAMRASGSGVADLIQPGDYVDVTAFFDKSSLIPQSTTKTVLSGLRVYALDGDTRRRRGNDRAKNLRNIQLLINEHDTAAWELANRLGEVTLLISNENDFSDDGSGSGQAFMDWLDELQNPEDGKPTIQDKFAHLYKASVQPKPVPKPKRREGFKMIKHTGGQVIEYWIEKGQLPRQMGNLGGPNSNVAFDESFVPTTGEAVSGSGDSYDEASKESQYSYLNGEDSPFFKGEDQPPEPKTD